MPSSVPAGNTQEEPLRRFYPPQGEQPQQNIPGNPSSFPQQIIPDSASVHLRKPSVSGHPKKDDAAYLGHRHPVLLQRLYNAADILLDSCTKQDFIYDAYPDYLSLRLMRDRLLRKHPDITETFLREGCPITWLNILTDTVISELLYRKRCSYRNPSGDASTTSVRFAPRS